MEIEEFGRSGLSLIQKGTKKWEAGQAPTLLKNKYYY